MELCDDSSGVRDIAEYVTDAAPGWKKANYDALQPLRRAVCGARSAFALLGV
jgi:hypothetical protein